VTQDRDWIDGQVEILPIEQEIFEHATPQVGMPLSLMLKVDKETSSFALEAGLDEQIPGPLSCVESVPFLVDELDCLEIDEPGDLGKEGVKEALEDRRSLEEHFKHGIVVHGVTPDAHVVSCKAGPFHKKKARGPTQTHTDLLGRYISGPLVGIRPGEKLCEQLLIAEEGTTATKFDKIYVAPPVDYDWRHLDEWVEL